MTMANDNTIPTPPPESSETAPGVEVPAAPERPHLDMRPEDMFPEDANPDPSGLRNPFYGKPPPDRRPQWIYRQTAELTGAEVRKLFIPTPHESLAKLVTFCEDVIGRAAETARMLGGAPYVPPPPRKGVNRLTAAVQKIAERFDLVPRAVADHAVQIAKAETAVSVRYEHLKSRIEFAHEVQKKVTEILDGVYPNVKAETREGTNYAGRRVIAVWSDPKNPSPTVEPEF